MRSFLGKLQRTDLRGCFDISNSLESSSAGLRGRGGGSSSLERGKSWRQHDLQGSLGYERACKGRGRCLGSGVQGQAAETSQPWWMHFRGSTLSLGTDRQTLPRTSSGSFQPTQEISQCWFVGNNNPSGEQQMAHGALWSAERTVPSAVELYLSW